MLGDRHKDNDSLTGDIMEGQRLDAGVRVARLGSCDWMGGGI